MAYEFQQFLDSLLEARPKPDSPPKVDKRQIPEQHRNQIQNFIDDKMGFPANAIFFLNGLDLYIQTQKKPDAVLNNLRTRAHIAWMAEINDSAATAMKGKVPQKNLFTEILLKNNDPKIIQHLNNVLPHTGDLKIDEKLKSFFLLHLISDMGSIDIAAMMTYRLLHEVAQNPSIHQKSHTPIHSAQNYYSILSERRMAMEDKIKALIIERLSPSAIKEFLKLQNPLPAYKSVVLSAKNSLKKYINKQWNAAQEALKDHMHEKWDDAQQAVKHLKIYAQLKQHPDLFEFYLDVLLNSPQESEDRRKILQDSSQFILFWKEVAEMGLLTHAQEKTLHKIMTVRKLLLQDPEPLSKKDFARMITDKRLVGLLKKSSLSDEIKQQISMEITDRIKTIVSTASQSTQQNIVKIFPYLKNTSAQQYIAALFGVLLVDKKPEHLSGELNQQFKQVLQDISSSEKIDANRLQRFHKALEEKNTLFAYQVKKATPEDFNARMAEWDLLRATMAVVNTLIITKNPVAVTLQLQKALEDVVKADKHHHQEVLSIRSDKEKIWSTVRSYSALKVSANGPRPEEPEQEHLHHPAPH